MKNRAIYLFLGLLILAAGFFAYHFYAAHNAELTLDKTIREITTKSGFSIDYSSINVSPFSGDILFSDINIIRDQDIQRARSARFDLTYTDFLNFMFWGAESGLKRIESGKLQLKQLSYINRRTLLEVKVDSIGINYQGNLWNLIVLGITKTPAQIQHTINATGTSFTFSQPENGAGIVRADTLHVNTRFGKRPANTDLLFNRVSLSDITWTPPALFQKKYRFFIQGFGYQTDSIPFRKADLTYDYHSNSDQLMIQDFTLSNELFTTTIQGNIRLDEQELSQSRFDSLSIRVSQMSPRFKNFLQQAKQLIGLQLPDNSDEVNIHLNGPFSEPNISLMP